MQRVSVQSVSADVDFTSNTFPDYGLGLCSNCLIDEYEGGDGMAGLSAPEIVAREAAQLLERQKQLAVRDFAGEFGECLTLAQVATANLDEQVRLKEAALVDQQMLIGKIHQVLEGLRGRVAGRNLDDVDEALTAVELLTDHLAEHGDQVSETEAEVWKLAAEFKQEAEEVQKVVEEARAVANAEIESARAAIQRIEEALDEQEKAFSTTETEELVSMRKEVQEARRIKLLHESSKAVDMGHEIHGLRKQIAEKAKEVGKLRKELCSLKGQNGHQSEVYQLEGSKCLGSCLKIVTLDDTTSGISNSNIQWYRVSAEGDKTELISGAIKAFYAPEPFDVGTRIKAEITSIGGQRSTLITRGCIEPAPTLGNYVEALVRKGGVEFQVVVLQHNGEILVKQSSHGFHISKTRIKLRKGRTIKAKEAYSEDMQLCGARAGGSSVAQELFWRPKKGLMFLLQFESARERNASIMLARKFAFQCNVILVGPDDGASLQIYN